MSRLVQIDLTTFTEIAVADREMQDAWLDFVRVLTEQVWPSVADDCGLQEPAERMTIAVSKLSALIAAAYHASEAELPSPSAGVQ